MRSIYLLTLILFLSATTPVQADAIIEEIEEAGTFKH